MKREAWRLWRIEEIFLSRKGRKQIKAAWLLKRRDPWPVYGEGPKCAMQWHGTGSCWAQAELPCQHPENLFLGLSQNTSSLQKKDIKVLRQLYLFLLSLNPMWKRGRSRSHSSSVGKADPSTFHWVTETKPHKLGQPGDQSRCWQMLEAQRPPKNDAGGLDGPWQLKASLLAGQQSHCLCDRSLSFLPYHILPGGCRCTPKLALWQGIYYLIISNSEGLQFCKDLHFIHEGDENNPI